MYWISGQQRDLNLAQFAAYWNDLAHPKVATDIQTLLDVKADLETLCTDTSQCSAELEAHVSTLVNKLNTAVKVGK